MTSFRSWITDTSVAGSIASDIVAHFLQGLKGRCSLLMCMRYINAANSEPHLCAWRKGGAGVSDDAVAWVRGAVAPAAADPLFFSCTLGTWRSLSLEANDGSPAATELALKVVCGHPTIGGDEVQHRRVHLQKRGCSRDDLPSHYFWNDAGKCMEEEASLRRIPCVFTVVIEKHDEARPPLICLFTSESFCNNGRCRHGALLSFSVSEKLGRGCSCSVPIL